jgi:hypothetical protein
MSVSARKVAEQLAIARLYEPKKHPTAYRTLLQPARAAPPKKTPPRYASLMSDPAPCRCGFGWCASHGTYDLNPSLEDINALLTAESAGCRGGRRIDRRKPSLNAEWS